MNLLKQEESSELRDQLRKALLETGSEEAAKALKPRGWLERLLGLRSWAED